MLAKFIVECPKGAHGDLPDDVQRVIGHILKCSQAPFATLATSYPPTEPETEKFSFFPHLPQRHGPGNYAADKQCFTHPVDDCRKNSYDHPTLTPGILTPGIFTIYCPHGICYGFDVLRSCESPRHPFEIFTTRFDRPPAVIVYDNACHLHTYCLNREPKRFQTTRFVVDRFHWRGHKGCSLGYCMDQYTALHSLNSQVNEQANAGLQHIKGQLAYMSIDNFMFHLCLF